MKITNWVSVGLLFIAGVILVSGIFSITKSNAGGSESQVVYGIVSHTDGEYAYAKQISEAMDIELKIAEPHKLMPLDIVTVVIEDGEVVNWSFSTEEERGQLFREYFYTLQEYRDGIIATVYE